MRGSRVCDDHSSSKSCRSPATGTPLSVYGVLSTGTYGLNELEMKDGRAWGPMPGTIAKMGVTVKNGVEARDQNGERRKSETAPDSLS